MHRLGALWCSTVLDMETTYTKIYDRKYLPLNLFSWNLTVCRSIVKVLSTLDIGPFRLFCVHWTARSREIHKVYDRFPYTHNSYWNLWLMHMYSIFYLIQPLPINYLDLPLCLKTVSVNNTFHKCSHYCISNICHNTVTFYKAHLYDYHPVHCDSLG